MKFAVTFFVAFTVSVSGLVAPDVSPLQPRNRLPAAGVAVSVTLVPGA